MTVNLAKPLKKLLENAHIRGVENTEIRKRLDWDVLSETLNILNRNSIKNIVIPRKYTPMKRPIRNKVRTVGDVDFVCSILRVI